VQELSTEGIPPIITAGTPGTQGAVVAGMQGIGVNTPNAAAVAVATVGLATLEHTPNGGMFTMGTLSMIFAAGTPPAITRLIGKTCSVAGAAPKLHCSSAPLVTCEEMATPLGLLGNAIVCRPHLKGAKPRSDTPATGGVPASA